MNAMRTILPSLVIGVALLVACAGPRPVPPPPPAVQAPAAPASARIAEQSVDAVIYHNASAETHRLFEQGYELARFRLDINLAVPHDLPPAVIVDVDETVLDNSPYQVGRAAKGLGFEQGSWTVWCNEARAKALPGAVDFLLHARDRGCEVFYITNRNQEERAATIRNLATEGFPFADDAHVMVMGSSSDKTERRARVAADHYVALLVGDQLTDMDQRFKSRVPGDRELVQASGIQDSLARYFVLLPNPMYGTWMDVVTGRVDSLRAGNKQKFLEERSH